MFGATLRLGFRVNKIIGHLLIYHRRLQDTLKFICIRTIFASRMQVLHSNAWCIHRQPLPRVIGFSETNKRLHHQFNWKATNLKRLAAFCQESHVGCKLSFAKACSMLIWNPHHEWVLFETWTKVSTIIFTDLSHLLAVTIGSATLSDFALSHHISRKINQAGGLVARAATYIRFRMRLVATLPKCRGGLGLER